MFPNIDNNLRLLAVRNALESRIRKFPSTECMLEHRCRVIPIPEGTKTESGNA